MADKHPGVVEQLLKLMQKHREDVVPGKPQR